MAEAEKRAEHEHEYELIPVSPLRRLEKRLDQLETHKGFDSTEFYREILDIIRMNQLIVDELAKANDSLRIELSKLPSKLEDLISRMDELISFIKASATEEVSGAQQQSVQPLSDKLDQLIEATKKVYESNQSVTELLGDIERKLKRPLPPPPRKPTLFPPRPI